MSTTPRNQPVASIPYVAKERGAKIIEVNIEPSAYTSTITDVFLRGKASELLQKLLLAVS